MVSISVLLSLFRYGWFVMGVLDVLGVVFLQEESCRKIYSDPASGTIAMGSLYVSGFFLGLFEAYCTIANTWSGLGEQFKLIGVMANSPLASFLVGFLGAVMLWALFTVLGVFVGRKHQIAVSGVAVVTACATVPLSVTLLFPILHSFGVRFILGVDIGWLFTLVAFVWVVAAEVRAITAIP